MSSTKTGISHIGDEQYKINGVLDFDSVPDLMREIKKVLKDKSTASISFSGVEHTNSAGLALLLDIARFMQGKIIQFTDIPQQMNVVANAYGVSDELRTQGLINSEFHK